MTLRPLLAVAFLAIVATCHADKFCFIVAGDGRSDPAAKPLRIVDLDGVNTMITAEIAQAVLDEKAKFLMWTGDLVLGHAKDRDNFKTQLLRWRSIMQPLYDRKIPVLPCRGNHEAFSKDAENVWHEVFSGRYALPTNGPKTEKNLSFFARFGEVLIVGLDQFTAGGISVDQPWLDQVLEIHRRPFVFVMGHEPAFMDGAHKDNMDNSPARRDAFWESLIKAGGRTFFAGHDHLYDHMRIYRNAKDAGPEMHQFVAGTSGAPFYKAGPYAGNNTIWNVSRVKYIESTYGYLLVEIDGNKATITFKGRTPGGKYEPMDQWSYTVDRRRR
jgi:hypothetical protein